MAHRPSDDEDGTATHKVAVPASATPPYTVKDGVVEAAAQPPAHRERPHDPAAWMHQRLVHQIMEFEKNLGPEHEVGGRFVQGPSGEPLHLSNVASWSPDMILFMGEFADGRKWELMQHYSQVSLLLVAIPRTSDTPRRIGFDLARKYEEQWGDPVS